jgi:cytochrome b involved in lipid metabolism
MTPDYTVRVQDGYIIFRWWRAYVPKDVSEGKCSKNMKKKKNVKKKKNENFWIIFKEFSHLQHSLTSCHCIL